MSARSLLVAIVVATASAAVAAQEGMERRYAPIDLTGTWVSVVTEDWAVRMIPPPKGNVESLPLTPAAREAANQADVTQLQAAGRACDAYGAPAIMREPGRIRISWKDDRTLKIETDAGEQTRLLHFGSAPAAAPSRQGTSIAEWQYANGFNPLRAEAARAAAAGRAGGAGGGRAGGGGGRGRGAATAPSGGRLKVVTSNLTAGLLRKNGVPYTANATMTEYYNLLAEPNGTQWFVVTTVIHDPETFVVDYVTSTNFRKEPDGSKWRPQPCSLVR